MSAAIFTRYHGATNTKGARWSARMRAAPTAWIPYTHELSALEGHEAAARALMARQGWPVGCPLAVGDMLNGYVFVRTDRR